MQLKKTKVFYQILIQFIEKATLKCESGGIS